MKNNIIYVDFIAKTRREFFLKKIIRILKWKLIFFLKRKKSSSLKGKKAKNIL